jgi:hypothetical protein
MQSKEFPSEQYGKSTELNFGTISLCLQWMRYAKWRRRGLANTLPSLFNMYKVFWGISSTPVSIWLGLCWHVLSSTTWMTRKGSGSNPEDKNHWFDNLNFSSSRLCSGLICLFRSHQISLFYFFVYFRLQFFHCWEVKYVLYFVFSYVVKNIYCKFSFNCQLNKPTHEQKIQRL